MVFYNQVARIESNDLVLIFQVNVDISSAVGRAVFRTATQIDGTGDRT